MTRILCEICGAVTDPFGSKVGAHRTRTFHLRHCRTCRFTFVEDPDTDYDHLYDAAYYAGQGADPLVDYEQEWREYGRTVRRYEWQGVTEVVNALTTAGPPATWLDYGCGNGGLVRWLQTRHPVRVAGFDSGYIVDVNRSRGLPMLSEADLEQWHGQCDVVTAIEVIEHVTEPLKLIQTVYELLRPGGCFFFTTGNAEPHRRRFSRWGYVVPEIHISFYEPSTMERALRTCGFEARFPGYLRGFDRIIQYKVLKSLRVDFRNPLLDALPWPLLSRIVDRRHRVSAFPVGYKPA